MAGKLPWDQYSDDVLAGKVVACKWVKLACERYKRDRETGEARGLHFDEDAALHVVSFFSVLSHWKGEWAGQPLRLEPWQQFIVANLFGWKREDGTRRFRTAMVTTGRKSGKTTLSAGLGLYLAVMDGEPGAEVVVASTKMEQSRISHTDAVQMVRRSEYLRREVRVIRDNLFHEASASKFVPLGRDTSSLDGLNLHGIIADEVHQWKDPSLFDVLQTATSARRQPLLIAISTAGYDRESLCFQLWTYAETVLMGTVEDDSFFGILYTLDDPAEWADESQWPCANPNLGISNKMDELRRQAAQAKEMPSRLNAFLRWSLNTWTQSESRWLDIDKWNACDKGPIDEAELEGRRCYAGLDLSSTKDLTALTLVFPPEEPDGDYVALARIFIPEVGLHARVRRDKVPYDSWLREGLVVGTPGDVTDYEYVIHQLGQDMQRFDLHELAFDRWGSSRITTQLQDELGFRVDAKAAGGPLLIAFGQGYADMSGPTRELEKLVLAGRLSHGGNRALAWQAGNVVVQMDAAGNIKMHKGRSTDRIDSMVALVMALDRAIRHGGPKRSVYESRGIRSITHFRTA